jgi:large subunit ribosomal protein L30
MASKGKAQKQDGAILTLEYYRSGIGALPKHKLVLKGLGFKRLNQVVTRVDTPAVRGMVAQVPHLVRIINR